MKPEVVVVKQTAVISTESIATVFSRRHSDILIAINKLLPVLRKDFARQNFMKSSFRNATNQEIPCYLVTKSGFAVLPFGLRKNEEINHRVRILRYLDNVEEQLPRRRRTPGF